MRPGDDLSTITVLNVLSGEMAPTEVLTSPPYFMLEVTFIQSCKVRITNDLFKVQATGCCRLYALRFCSLLWEAH